MDWTGCNLVEIIPGKVSGVPLIKGTRIPAEAILINSESGSSLDELVEDYPSASRAPRRANPNCHRQRHTRLLPARRLRQIHPPTSTNPETAS
jgi:uncharacterized protein (DUF433 family)